MAGEKNGGEESSENGGISSQHGLQKETLELEVKMSSQALEGSKPGLLLPHGEAGAVTSPPTSVFHPHCSGLGLDS